MQKTVDLCNFLLYNVFMRVVGELTNMWTNCE